MERVLPEKLIVVQVVKLSRPLWNQNVHYLVHKGNRHWTTSCHVNPVHTLTPCFLMMLSSFILPSMPVSSEWSLSLQAFPPNFTIHFSSPYAFYMPRPSHPSWSDYHNNIWWIIGTLCWALSTLWGIFDIHDVSGVDSTSCMSNIPQTMDNVQHSAPIMTQPLSQTFR
jgi:hypothetical protein